jgi:homocitrate synthase NifV
MPIDHAVILEDTTLRDGEQTPGVGFNETTKLAIFHALCEAGISWIEVGIPAMGGSEKRSLYRMLDENPGANLVAWNRGVRADIAESLDMGFRHVHIGLPTSAIHLDKSIGKDLRWLHQTACDLVRLAKDRGAYVSISAEDVGRTSPQVLQDYAGLVHEAGADRLRLSDTVGVLGPDGYAEKVRLARAAAPIALQCHCHNDFGMAVANTFAGLAAGASFFHVTVNGMGERAGMPDLAACVMGLKHFFGIDCGVDTRQLRVLADMLYRAIPLESRAWQAVVGDNVFAHESGIHVKGMLSDSNTFEPFSPAVLNGARRIVLGKHSGSAAIQYRLDQLGIEDSAGASNALLAEVRELAVELGTELSDEQLLVLHRRYQAEGGLAK